MYTDNTDTPFETRAVYYHFDRLGNVLALTDEDGDALETYSMDAFGVDQQGWEQDTYTTRRITGKEYDADIGLYFFEARWYDPEVGRFVSASRYPPDEEHPYALSQNAPTILVDPMGEIPWIPSNAIPSNAQCSQTQIMDEYNRMKQNVLNEIALENKLNLRRYPWNKTLTCQSWAGVVLRGIANTDNVCCWESVDFSGKRLWGWATHAWVVLRVLHVGETKLSLSGPTGNASWAELRRRWLEPNNVVWDAWQQVPRRSRGKLKESTMGHYMERYTLHEFQYE